MATIKELIEDKKLRRAYESPAKDLKDNLKKLTENIEIYQKRWFWELLQNACDFNDSVKVKLVIDRQKQLLTFTHDGLPFKVDEAMNLIAPDTSKDKAERLGKNHVIGKFGTGFISTHILSSSIKVVGQIVNTEEVIEKKEFEFKLDRVKYDDRDKLIESMTLSEIEFIESQSDYTQEVYSTSFIYDLKNSFHFIDSEVTIDAGLNFMAQVLPYVFAFTASLVELSIMDGADEIIITGVKNANKENDNSAQTHLNISGILPRYPQFSNLDELHVWTSGNWHWKNTPDTPFSMVACLFEKNSLVSIKTLPKIYCDFPLIGSEEFPFPVVINSHQFIPTSDRNGISITTPDETNKNILKLSASGYQQLLKFCENTIGDLHSLWNLASIPNVGNESAFKSLTNLYLQYLHNTKIVKTRSGVLAIKDCIFTWKGSMTNKNFEEFAYLTSEFYNNSPNYLELIEWSKHLPFYNSQFDGQKLSIEKLIKSLVNSCITLADLDIKMNSISGREWLYKLYSLLIETEESKYFERENILLSKSEIFIQKDNKIFWGYNFDPELVQAYNSLFKTNLFDFVIDDEFFAFKTHLVNIKSLSRKELCNIIDDGLKEFSEQKTELFYVESVEPILHFTSNLNDELIYEYFPWFAMNRLTFVLNTLANPKDEGKYFSIYKSGKIDILAQIATVSYTSQELNVIANNPELIKYLIKNEGIVKSIIENSTRINALSVDGFKILIIDDEQFANSATGDRGESIVFEELKKIFHSQGYSVIWASRDEGQPAYDFRVMFNEDIFLYVDAKTTTTAITQSDSIPFFLRKSQWDFLQNLENKYWIARVFLGGVTPVVKFLKVTM